MEGLMVAAHGKGRLLKVMSGSGWQLMVEKMAEKWPSRVKRGRTVLGHVEASYGGCGGLPWW